MSEKRYWYVGTEDGKRFLKADLKGTLVGPDDDYSLWDNEHLAKTIADYESGKSGLKLVAKEYKQK